MEGVPSSDFKKPAPSDQLMLKYNPQMTQDRPDFAVQIMKGAFVGPAGFLREAVQAVHAAGGLFIADEVQPGSGRTGEHMWGYRRGAVISRPEILAAFCERTGYFNTFAATPVAAAVGQAVLDTIRQENLLSNAALVGARRDLAVHAMSGAHG